MISNTSKIPHPSNETVANDLDNFKFVGYNLKHYKKMVKIIHFKDGFYVKLGKKPPKKKNISQGSIDALNLIRSMSRTKTALRDYCIENQFEWFGTFTFAEDRGNVNLCKTKMQTWLHKQKRKNSDFKYLIVPEFHQDKQSLHFHALISGILVCDLEPKHYPDHRPVISRRGNQIYQHKDYCYGKIHSLEQITGADGLEQVGTYIGKYITKDMPLFPGKKRYWCSRDLIKPASASFEYIDTSGIDQAFIVLDNDEVTIFEIPID